MTGAGWSDLDLRLRSRLDPLGQPRAALVRSDFDLNPQFRPQSPQVLKPAAVLAPIVRRPTGWTLILTRRTDTMPSHAGQVSFPGGRVQPEDPDALATALRETQEEIGLPPQALEPLGAFDPYETVTGYAITPFVAYVDPGFAPVADPREVAEVFEAPLSFLFDPRNHERHEREWAGGTRAYYVMPYAQHFIWGATAGMIKALYHRLYDEPALRAGQG